MSYTITNSCISCQRCLADCPTNAIQTDGSSFWINANLCTQCEGSHGVAQCWAVCPTNEGCVPLFTGATAVSLNSEPSTDYWNNWFANYSRMVARLKNAEQSSYWRHWFDVYSQTLQNLQTHSTSAPLMP
ncbi:MAG: 4Fe-4S dicluster domain-containing protein [Cyanobacteria bacterium P01_H01_bin.21]